MRLTWKLLLDVLTCEMSVSTMPVSHSEEMHPQLPHQIGHEHIRVLILLTRVARDMSDTCSESKLGDAIEPVSRCGQILLFGWSIMPSLWFQFLCFNLVFHHLTLLRKVIWELMIFENVRIKVLEGCLFSIPTWRRLPSILLVVVGLILEVLKFDHKVLVCALWLFFVFSRCQSLLLFSQDVRAVYLLIML
jgi:hypothetical protein